MSRWTSFLLLLLFPVFCFAQQEEIKDFKVDLELNEDGSLTVSEQIIVFANGQEIKRGIYRSIPLGRSAQFELISVEKDGLPAPYTTSSESGRAKIKIGEESVLIPQGLHRYKIVYKVQNQIRFFDDYDELYWNATGTEWTFPILQARVHVKVPQRVQIKTKQTFAYTGREGEAGVDYRVELRGKELVYESTKRFAPKEGITISFAWQKGVFEEPSWAVKNLDLLKTLFGFLFIPIGYLVLWFKYGKDPDLGTVIPYYEPPDGMSAADVRYIYKMGFDNKTLAAGLIGLGVKGCLKVDKRDALIGQNLILSKVRDAKLDALTSDENELLELAFAGSSDMLLLASSERAKIAPMVRGYKEALKSEHYGDMFVANAGLTSLGTLGVVPGVALLPESMWTFLGMVAAVFSIGFAFLMRRPTEAGISTRRKLAGLKMYLETAEAHRFEHMSKREKLEHFEALFPYAVALDVENDWADKFSSLLASLTSEDTKPFGWYDKGQSVVSDSNFASKLTSSVASAVSTSSGSTGGGSTGGGGGGGGGGGW